MSTKGQQGAELLCLLRAEFAWSSVATSGFEGVFAVVSEFLGPGADGTGGDTERFRNLPGGVLATLKELLGVQSAFFLLDTVEPAGQPGTQHPNTLKPVTEIRRTQ